MTLTNAQYDEIMLEYANLRRLHRREAEARMEETNAFRSGKAMSSRMNRASISPENTESAARTCCWCRKRK